MKRLLLIACAWATALSVGSCSDDDLHSPDIEQTPPPINDIVHGALIHFVDLDKIDTSHLKLGDHELIDIVTENNDICDFTCELIGDKPHLVAKPKGGQNKPFKVVKVKITPDGDETKARTLMVVLRRKTPEVRGEAMLSSYSEYIGKSTVCYAQFPNTKSEVLVYDQILDLPAGALTVNSTLNTMKMVEMSGESYQSMLTEWAFNIGASFQHTAPMGFSLKPSSSTKLVLYNPQKGSRKRVLSGSFDFGMGSKLKASRAYEYYMNLYTIQKSEVRLDMSRYEYSENNEMPDESILYILNDRFAMTLQSSSINATRFFDDWGTDVITQGLFGGYNIFVYGRSENTYEKSVGIDACLAIKNSAPSVDVPIDWIDIYKNKGSDYVSVDGSGEYRDEKYAAASKAVSFSLTHGGNQAIVNENPQAWLDGFTDSNDTWSLISYRMSSDYPQSSSGRPDEDTLSDDVSHLYPIEQLAYNVVTIYYLKNKDTMTEADAEAYNRVAENINKLIEAKEDYLNSKTKNMTEKPRLVIADMIMKYGANGHVKGDPKPFVDYDARGGGPWVYYPMMANSYAPEHRGYAFDSSDDNYTVAIDTKDEYWYYALAAEDDCDGIVGVQFEKSGTSAVKGYEKRGNSSHEGSNDTNTKNYLWVKYFDPKYDKASSKITAVGFRDKKNSKIITSTGGSELRRGYLQSEKESWDAFWKDYKSSKKYWNEGGIDIHYHQFYPVWQTKDLPIERFNEETVCHPLRWGE